MPLPAPLVLVLPVPKAPRVRKVLKVRLAIPVLRTSKARRLALPASATFPRTCPAGVALVVPVPVPVLVLALALARVHSAACPTLLQAGFPRVRSSLRWVTLPGDLTRSLAVPVVLPVPKVRLAPRDRVASHKTRLQAAKIRHRNPLRSAQPPTGSPPLPLNSRHLLLSPRP